MKEFELKCPYNTEIFYSYAEDGKILYKAPRPTECIKENCACWQDGKCTRK